MVTNTFRYEGEFKSGKFNGIGINIDFKGEAFEGNFENGKKNGHLNKYKMHLDSTNIYENDKLVEKIEKQNTEISEYLTRKNLNKNNEEFKKVCESLKNNLINFNNNNGNKKFMENIIDVNSILNENNNNTNNDKLKEILNFKDLNNNIGGSRMSSISSEINDDIKSLDMNSLKGKDLMQKNYNSNNTNNNTNFTEGNYLNTNNSEDNNNNNNPDQNCLIF